MYRSASTRQSHALWAGTTFAKHRLFANNKECAQRPSVNKASAPLERPACTNACCDTSCLGAYMHLCIGAFAASRYRCPRPSSHRLRRRLGRGRVYHSRCFRSIPFCKLGRRTGSNRQMNTRFPSCTQAAPGKEPEVARSSSVFAPLTQVLRLHMRARRLQQLNLFHMCPAKLLHLLALTVRAVTIQSSSLRTSDLEECMQDVKAASVRNPQMLASFVPRAVLAQVRHRLVRPESLFPFSHMRSLRRLTSPRPTLKLHRTVSHVPPNCWVSASLVRWRSPLHCTWM